MPSCYQCRSRRMCEGKASPTQHSYAEKWQANIRRPAAAADVQVYCLHSLVIRMLLLWLGEVVLVSPKLLCGRG
jgi:hypothetical protein